MYLVDIRVGFENARKSCFGKIMNFGSWQLLGYTPNHWRSQNYVANGAEPNE